MRKEEVLDLDDLGDVGFVETRSNRGDQIDWCCETPISQEEVIDIYIKEGFLRIPSMHPNLHPTIR